MCCERRGQGEEERQHEGCEARKARRLFHESVSWLNSRTLSRKTKPRLGRGWGILGNLSKSVLRLLAERDSRELAVETRQASAAVDKLLAAAGPGRMRARVDVEVQLIAFFAPGGARHVRAT